MSKENTTMELHCSRARPAESIRTASRHSTIAPSTDWSLGLMSIVVANWSPCWPSNRGMVASP